MYKYYDKKGYHVMYYDFDSMTEFLNCLERLPINTNVFKPHVILSHKADYEWYKTDTFAQAVDLAKYGSKEGFDRFYDLKVQLERHIKLNNKKAVQSNDYIGYAPDVKAYLEGNPLTMFNKIRPQRKQIDIYFNTANLVDVTTEQIYNRGVITLCLVEILEALGFSVNLNIFAMSYKMDEVHYAKFTLKSDNEQLNMQRLFFPMCHPSWCRRLIFNLREKTPDITVGWHPGYGRTCGEDMIRTIIDLDKNDIVISRPEEMGIMGEDILTDAVAMFDYINKDSDRYGFKLLNK